MAATVTGNEVEAFVARFNAQQAAKARIGECTGSRNLPMTSTPDAPMPGRVRCHVCGQDVRVTGWGKLYVHQAGN